MVLKICHTRCVPPEDISAINKIAKWEETSLDKLAILLEKFQKYQTLDAASKGARLKIRRREAKSMTKAMFRQLGRCTEQYFVENFEKVISNTISLQNLLTGNEKILLLLKTERNAALAAGVDDHEQLKEKYPLKFDQGVLENFLGAEVYGKKANKQGDRLNSYIKSVKTGTTFEDPVKLNICENILDITSEVMDQYDILVLRFDEFPESYIRYLIDHVGVSYSLKETKSVFLVLNCESELLKVLNCLECWREKPNFHVSLCLFEKEDSQVNTNTKAKENVTFAVLFGKVTVFKGHMKTAHKDLETNLPKIIEQISPPFAKIAYISVGNIQVLD